MVSEKARSFFIQAERLYDKGLFEESIKGYKQALEESPLFEDAIINLSSALLHTGHAGDALMYLRKAIDRSPENPALLNNYANILASQQRHSEALPYYQRALKLNIDSLQIKQNLAVSLQQTGNLQEAVRLYEEILAKDPFNNQALINLSLGLNSLGLFERSLEYLNRSLKIDSQNPEVLNIIALTFESLNRPDRAEGCFKRAIQLRRAYYGYHYNLANLLSRQGRIDEAISEYEKAIKLNNKFTDGYIQLGNHLKTKKMYKEALEAYKGAFSSDTKSYEAYNNTGNVYRELKEYPLALEYLKRAVEIKPDHAGAYFNMGLLYKEMFDYNSAIDSYKKAVEIDNNYPEAHWNLALLLLLTGRFKEGWIGYEWRRRLTLYSPYIRSFSMPQWEGEDLRDRTILLNDEQGFGDAIQFIRYAPRLKELGAKVIVECLSPLTRIFEGALGVDKVVTRGMELPEFHCHCSIMTLPKIFDTDLTSIPVNVPYLKVRQDMIDQWAKRVSKTQGKINVGIAWAGINPPHKSCRIEDLMPLLRDSGLRFYSLQKGPAQDALKIIGEEIRITDLMNESTDFADTAALMMNLELIITIDTSIAHLAGALGLPVWVMLHYDADWRWLLDRSDSPWYPTMRLFRQTSPGDWTGVIGQISSALCHEPLRSNVPALAITEQLV